MKCKRCGRKLKAKQSRERGYGLVCWEKAGKYTKLEELEREVKELKSMIQSFENHTKIPLPTYNPPIVEEKRDSANIMYNIPSYVEELKENRLFVKMRALVGA